MRLISWIHPRGSETITNYLVFKIRIFPDLGSDLRHSFNYFCKTTYCIMNDARAESEDVTADGTINILRVHAEYVREKNN